jgi:activator of 2-hydroxyglutaryl-CoA dehydratase
MKIAHNAVCTVHTSPANSRLRDDKCCYIIYSKELQALNIKPDKACGHMGGKWEESSENEIIALAKGALRHVTPDATVLDLGSRDAKWIKFRAGKFHDMDWNTSCASSTGATVEMLMKFYDLGVNDLAATREKFAVTCGIFGLEKIMDDISNGGVNEMGSPPDVTMVAARAVSKFIHGIAYNAWTFAKKPEVLYLSGGFCENECFVKSLENYCKVVPLGRFVLCEGLIDE